ncbi:MAG: riboflavin biosynthesis protein RibF [Oscillospiraceae bacterium]|jgi:riboflavin kinase/FMN adenylyltransferase|nr:riboflavin biosynthesis protein RibF [Oscillospiraceae bacterium]MCI1989806.1 riboflavin biosynthesis protein RibF [Oscillospiraceae bacterium]MCI2035552.1 riboflavin biosynthesis protein RibF [Oscillospiraceae bacterium]
MKVYHDLTPSEGESAVALGSFDGLHLGHRRVISLALEGAGKGLVPTVLTFAENPKLRGNGEFGGLLLAPEEKIRLLERMGVGQLYLLDFDAVKDLSPEAFVAGILEGTCRAKRACCGFNYTFGRGGTAGSADLRRLCAGRGIEAAVAGPVLADGTPVSSTRIRGLIANGRTEEAARLLGRPFGYESAVIPGRRLGRRLGTPTLNQKVPEEFVRPRFGVYASAVTVGRKTYCGVTDVGVKPTVGSSCVLAETWMPGYTGPDLYGRTVRVGLLKFLRPERRFPGLDELREEIRRNGRQAAEYFRKNHPFPGEG